jgi:hypothetical protein
MARAEFLILRDHNFQGYFMRLARAAIVLIIGVLLLAIIPVAAQSAPRPVQRIKVLGDDTKTVELRGSVHRLARPEFDRGSVAQDLPMERMVLLLRGTDEQEAALEKFLVDVQDGSSPQYRKWLTPEEFGTRFGVAEGDLQTIGNWLTSRGFFVRKIAQNRRMMEFSGTAGQVSAAFHTEIHKFEIEGEEHFANANDPSIPATFASVVSGLVSLHNVRHRSMHRLLREESAPGKRSTVPFFNESDGQHVIGPWDFAKIYNVIPVWDSGIDGSGQTIAIAARSNVWWGDFSTFQIYFNLPWTDPIAIFTGADPGLSDNGDVAEATVDVEWSNAIAKRAKVILVISQSTNTTDGIDLSSMYAVDHNVAPILNVSYGFCEADAGSNSFYNNLWKQAAAQGISVVVSTGDNGSTGCDDPSKTAATRGFSINAIASTPHNVAVGGTQFNENGQDSTYWSPTNDVNHASVLSYIPEMVWNESGSEGLWASSGGVSKIFATPTWQTGPGVPGSDPNNPSGHHRYIPDVSLAAGLHDGYFTCIFTSCSSVDSTGQIMYHVVGGTSLSAPAFAGVLALVNQKTNSIQGNPNFHLYPLSSVAGIYHDVTTGTNAVACSAGTGCDLVSKKMTGYAAGPGFDLATGWGSMDVSALVNNWGSITFKTTTVTGTVAPTTVQHGKAIALSASVTSSTGTPTGVITAYAVSGSTTIQFGDADVVNGTASFAPVATAMGGTSTVFFRYGGDGVYGSSISAGTTLTVTPEPSVTSVVPLTQNPMLGFPYVITVHVAAQSGVGVPTGDVTIKHGASVVGTGTVDSNGNAGVYSQYYPTGGPGSYTFTVSYAGDSGYATSSSTVVVTFGKAGANVSFSCNNSTRDVLLHYPIECTFLSSGYTGGPVPSGSVQMYDMGSLMGAPITLVSGGFKLTLDSLPVGTHEFVATYNGDSWYEYAAVGSFRFSVVAQPIVGVLIQQVILGAAPGQGLFIPFGVSTGQFGPNLTGKVTVYDGGNPVRVLSVPANSTSYYDSIYVNTGADPWVLGEHVLSVKYSGDPFWPDTSSASQNILITTGDFLIRGFENVTLHPGQTYFNYLTVLPIANLNGNVSMTCTGAPAQTICEVPASTILNSSASIKITTTGPHLVSSNNDGVVPWMYVALLPFGLIFAGGLNRRSKAAVSVMVMLTALVILASCGGGGGSRQGNVTPVTPPPSGGTLDPGTPTGTYTLTVTATYGSGANAIAHTYPVTLTVN